LVIVSFVFFSRIIYLKNNTKMSNTTTEKLQNILIMGAGLAGLTLANYLQLHNIPYQVYERDASANVRPQGWSITLNFALKALKRCLPEEAFEDLNTKISTIPEKDEGLSFSFCDANTSESLMTRFFEPGTSYRANRERLRNWLLERVKDNVNWGKKVLQFQEDKDAKTVTVFFEDGTQATGDLLVGCDGIRSPIASQLLGGKEEMEKLTVPLPIDSFGVLHWVSEEIWLRISSNPNYIAVLNGQHEQVEGVKGKVFNMFCSVKNIDRTRPDSYCISWSVSHYSGLPSSKKQLEDFSAEKLALTKLWAANGFHSGSLYQDLIMSTPDDTTLYPITVQDRYPIAEKIAAPGSRVVLVGDSAHPMTMFKGEGNKLIILVIIKRWILANIIIIYFE
jgi:2-polyprenyl-6-methoxyphenol hydroxylase-like FAD-dependent oxidoreductase